MYHNTYFQFDKNNLEKSDNMICTKRSYNMFKYYDENDTNYLYRMHNSQKINIRDIDSESKLWRSLHNTCILQQKNNNILHYE